MARSAGDGGEQARFERIHRHDRRLRRERAKPAIGKGFAGPETVAGVVAMLGSSDGAFITGTEIRVDGGTHF